MPKKKHAKPAPIQTTVAVLEWLKARFPKEKALAPMGHSSYEQAALWFFAWRMIESGYFDDFGTRDQMEMLRTGLAPITLQDCEDDLTEELNDWGEMEADEPYDLRKELEQFWRNERDAQDESDDE